MFLVVFAPDLGDDIDVRYENWQNDWANDPIGGIVSNGLVGWAIAGVALLIVARHRRLLAVVAHAHLPHHGRGGRGAQRHPVPLAPQRPARPHPGHQREPAALRTPLRHGEARGVGGRPVGQRAAVVPRVGARRRAARRHPAPRLGRARREGGPGSRMPRAARPGRRRARARRATAARRPRSRRRRRSSATASTSSSRPSSTRSLAPPESVVHLPLGRVIASTLLGGSTVWAIILVAIIVVGVSTGQLWVLFSFVPAAIGLVSYVWSRITKSLRYSIAGTPDGVRIGHGLLSTGNQTIPPGRIHAIEANQWILWRPFGWWSIRINVAGQSVSAGNEAAQRTLVLPVGTVADVHRVLALLLPDCRCGRRSARRRRPRRPRRRRRILAHARAGLPGCARSRGGASGGPPPTASRSSGGGGCCAASRSCRSRACSPSRSASGPIQRMLRLASVRIHTVTGPGRRHAARSPTATRPSCCSSAWPTRPSIAPHPTPRITGARPRHDRSRPMPAERAGRLGVGTIGAGRVGAVLAAALAGAGHALTGIAAVSESSRERAAAMLPGVPVLPVPEIVERSELVLLAVPEHELAALVDRTRRRRRLAARPARAAHGRPVRHAGARAGAGAPARSRSPCTRR